MLLSSLCKVNDLFGSYYSNPAVQINITNGSGFTYGDADNDGKIQAADARFCLRASVGLESCSFGTLTFRACDVDGNGVLQASDARLILRYSVGLESSFPIQKK